MLYGGGRARGGAEAEPTELRSCSCSPEPQPLGRPSEVDGPGEPAYSQEISFCESPNSERGAEWPQLLCRIDPLSRGRVQDRARDSWPCLQSRMFLFWCLGRRGNVIQWTAWVRRASESLHALQLGEVYVTLRSIRLSREAPGNSDLQHWTLLLLTLGLFQHF